MQIKILSALWGYEHYDLDVMLNRIRTAGFDGIETAVPEDEGRRDLLLSLVEKYGLCLVVQQHQADGVNFEAYRQSFSLWLERSVAVKPLLVNSHTGRDYFSLEQNLELIDMAATLSAKSGIKIVHETHRGRFGFSATAMKGYFEVRPELLIAADLSHWVCVSEGFLKGFDWVVRQAVARTRLVHARVGYEEGPQVPDPRAPEWNYATAQFLLWWDKIVEASVQRGEDLLLFTAEFGPPPYLQTEPFTRRPLADLFEINCHMKDLLAERYASYRQPA